MIVALLARGRRLRISWSHVANHAPSCADLEPCGYAAFGTSYPGEWGGEMAVTQTWNTTELISQDKAHLLHPVSNLRSLRDDGPLVMVRGEDVFLWDSDGTRYIDAFAGLWNVNVGHGRTELAEAAAAQIHEVAFVPNFFIDAGLFRPSEVDLLLGDVSLARAQLGWSPTVGFRDLVGMMVEADLALVADQRETRDSAFQPNAGG
jgi:hypothetical protein